jgi:hypothetical protein
LSQCWPTYATGTKADCVPLVITSYPYPTPFLSLTTAATTCPQISRKFDQSDAEGLLLRAGAKDPDAANWPGEAPAAAPAAAAAQPAEAAAAAAPPATAPVEASAPAVAAPANGGVSSPRAAAAVAGAAAGRPANGLLPHPAPRSIAASEGGDSESAMDSAASGGGSGCSQLRTATFIGALDCLWLQIAGWLDVGGGGRACNCARRLPKDDARH